MKGNFLLYYLLIATIYYENVKCQRKVSPCPTIFTYDLQSDSSDTWYGTLKLQSIVPLYGINVDVIFDRKVTAYGAHHFNEATTSDYMEFRLENKNFRLDPGRTLVMNIYVRYRDSVPLLKQVRLNGQNVCVDLPTISAVQPIYGHGNSNSQYDFESTRKPSTREFPDNSFDSGYDTTTLRRSISNNKNSQSSSTQSWYDDASYLNNRPTTTSRPAVNNKPFNQNSNAGRITTRPYNSYDQTSTNSNVQRQSNNDDKIYYDNSDRDIYNSDSNRDTGFSLVSDTSSNTHNSPVTLRPLDQRLSTTTTKYNSYNTRSSSTTYPSARTTKQSYFPGDLPFLNTESTTHPILNVDSENDCGNVIAKTNPLIIHGLETYPGNYPWHAAIYISEIGSLKYICGGSLISMSSILTAAHCVTRSKSKVPIHNDNLLVYLGKHNLQKWTGQEQDGKVVDIIINDEYDPERFYSDLAILKLKDPFRRTNYVRPVCIWSFESDLKHIVDKLGSVPGWGYNEDGLVSEDLSYIRMPVVTHETCIWSNRDFFSKITSEKSFCAGFRNGTSICNGDSGGGMVFKQANKWYIRGVVSVSIALQNSLRCDPDHYSVFVDVAKYTTWIKQNV